MTKNEKILEQGRKRFIRADTADRSERELFDQDLKFGINLDGCQWDPAVRDAREKSDPPRPCITINKIPEKIDVVDGEFRKIRPGVKIRPVDSIADPKIADIRGGLIRHIQYNSQARTAYNTSHTSTLYGGRGGWRIDIEDCVDDPFVRDIKINRIPNILCLRWDPKAKKLDRSDAEWWFVTEIITEEEFKARYGEKFLENWPDGSQWEKWKYDDGYLVAEYWWTEYKDKTFYQVEREIQGEVHIVTATELRDDETLFAQKTIKVPQIRHCVMTANQIIDGPHDDWPSPYFPFVVQFGLELNIRGEFKTRGKVRFAKEPLQMYNYWISAMTEQTALAPKIPYLISTNMIKGYEEIWQSAAEKNLFYLPYNIDPNAPGMTPKRESPAQMSTAYAQQLLIYEQNIMGAMGVHPPSLGDEGPEISGVAIEARKRQSSVGSYPFIDHFGVAVEHSTRIIDSLIPYVYDTERIVRILGEDDSYSSVPINTRPNSPILRNFSNKDQKNWAMNKEGFSEYINDLSVGKYDIVISIGPSYETQRQEALTILMELVKAIPAFGAAAIDEIVRNIDLPKSEKLIEKARKMVPPELRELTDEEQQAQAQQPNPALMLEMIKTELAKRDQDRKELETYFKGIKALAEAESKEHGDQLTAIKTMMEELRAQFMPQQNQTKQNNQME